MTFTRRAAAAVLGLILPVLLLAGEGRAAEPATLTILHINDLHGWALPFRRAEGKPEEGGLARLASQVARERTPSTLFLAAGDLTMGTNISNLFQGRPVIEALNRMGLDASAVGNHEFDNGLGVFRETAALAKFPFLAANVSGPGAEFLVPWKVVQVGPLRVGLFGLTTSDTPLATHPKNVTGLTFVPPIEAARKAVAALRPQSDLIVCVSHLGSEVDENLAALVPGISAIIGGHTHTKMDAPVLAGRTVVTQAFENGSFLGRLDLRIEDGKVTRAKGRLIPITAESGEDKDIAALVEEYRLGLEKKMGEAVGEAGTDFDGAKETLRSRETNLGDLVADMMREAASTDIAMTNGGGIRASIAKGPVTVGSIYNVLPFDNYIVAVKIPGRGVRQALEVGVSRVEERDGGFPQVSGIRFAFDPKAPPGARVREVSVGGRPLEDDRLYTLATNDFLAAGGNGYTMFAIREPVFNDSSRNLRDVMVEWWRGKGAVTIAPDGRITEAK